MIRFIFIFICSVTLEYISNGDIKKFDIYYALAFSFVFVSLWYLTDITKILSTIAGKDEDENDNKLVSFNDAVANELMRIRKDLAYLRVEKIKKEGGYPNFPNDFLCMFYIYHSYPSNFLCQFYYDSINKHEGMIVLVIDDNDIEVKEYIHEFVKFNANLLRTLNSPRIKKRKFKKNDYITILIHESEDIKIVNETEAKILSVDEKYFDDYTVTLEIPIGAISKDQSKFTPEEIINTKTIRKIEIRYDGNQYFTPDKKL